MSKLRVSYFDFPGGRGEDCRMALVLAGVDFEDNRVKGPAWAALKPATPYGSMPILEAEGKPVLAQSNAILTWIGRTYDLLPKDEWEAARHLAVLEAVEELRALLDPSGRIQDEDEKKRVRQELCAGPVKRWGTQIERQIEGPFVAGEKIYVSDLKLFTVNNWIKRGVLDFVPTDTLDEFPKLQGVYKAVAAQPKIAEWRARFT
jgi:glutathione S-transferase